MRPVGTSGPVGNIWSVFKISTTDIQNPKLSVLVRNARHRLGMTQRQLAELSTVSLRAIRDLELERTRAPRIQTVRLLADALRLSKARRAELEASAGPLAGELLIEKLTAPSAPLGPIIGRAQESAALAALAESSGHRLVKVSGIPGVGKTRLIHEVASGLHRSGRMPAICLDSAPGAGRPRTLLERIAGALGCGATQDDLAAAVAAGDLLLTVDARDLDEDDELELRLLLHRCPGLRVLYETLDATQGTGDPVLLISPLAVPDLLPGRADAGPAVEFLRSRCPRIDAQDTDDAAAAAALDGICRLLDGIPAALATVASWLEVHEPTDLLAIIAGSPAVLTSMLGTIPAQPDGSLIDWLRHIVAALPEAEAAALRHLAHAEPWTAREALRLLAGTPDGTFQTLHALQARGLARKVEAAGDGSGQFVILNVVRHVLDVDAAARAPRTGCERCAGDGSRAESASAILVQCPHRRSLTTSEAAR
ncbi:MULTISPECIES: helix-turn-helix transcriptional regulator [unclassified Streptomyces]|uniref:helix-turn-helix transcriptional regulator n=1 Tax=unclassified Streptomyces TaxID=2593676 RepID=UPI002E2B02AE|nr:helix-turn-helix transcriptional regulator [Streptomyces sp. NBC_00223]